jgi:hypothetical protein
VSTLQRARGIFEDEGNRNFVAGRATCAAALGSLDVVVSCLVSPLKKANEINLVLNSTADISY